MTSAARRWMIVFALLGLGASSSSAYVHYQLVADPGYLSFCDVSSTVSCTEAYLSRFGSFAGIPVALFGVSWFAFALLLTVAADRGSRAFRENVPGYLFATATLGLAASLYLAYASWFVLETVCLLCVATYVAVVGLFALSGAVTSIPMTSLPKRATNDLKTLVQNPGALAVSLAFVVAAGLAVSAFPREVGPSAPGEPQAVAVTDDTRSEFERWYEAQPRVELPIENAGEKVLIVKFNDFQCPPCRQTHMEYKSVLAKYEARAPGQVRYVLKDFPLDPECNAYAPNGQHLASCEAAVSVRLARMRGEGDRLIEHIFANQAILTPDFVRQAALQEAGVEDLGAQYASTLDLVKQDIELGHALQVNSTPTFFINGVMVPGGLQTQFFDAAIAYELEKASP
jgi:vitamin-K-epoxide reductase (warfarin-sensitive)